MPGGRLTQEDRRRIAAWLAEGLSHAEIGRRLSRPTSTITREVNRNRGPAGYQADQAQRATQQRARRRGTAPASAAAAAADPRADGRDPAAVGQVEQRLADALAQMGLPRMICRLLACLTTTDSGGMTSAELVRRLQVSPASISKAIGFLADQDDVVAPGREGAVGLVRHADRVQLPPAVKPQRLRQVEVLSFDTADRAGRERRGWRHERDHN